MLRTIVVEDEPLSRMYLCNLLAESFPDIDVVGKAAAEGEALDLINATNPDLVFLDIELQTGTGIRVATQLEACDPAIIFTTALDEKATNLLRITGVPYIQKPIDADSLAAAVNAARDKQNCAAYSVALRHLRAAMQQGGTPQAVLVQSSLPAYLPLADIVTVEALTKGSCIRMQDGSQVQTTDELKEPDSMLRPYGFFRTHMQYLIHLRHVAAIRHDSVLMQDGSSIPLSPKKPAALRDLAPAQAG